MVGTYLFTRRPRQNRTYTWGGIGTICTDQLRKLDLSSLSSIKHSSMGTWSKSSIKNRQNKFSEVCRSSPQINNRQIRLFMSPFRQETTPARISEFISSKILTSRKSWGYRPRTINMLIKEHRQYLVTNISPILFQSITNPTWPIWIMTETCQKNESSNAASRPKSRLRCGSHPSHNRSRSFLTLRQNK